MSQHIHSSGSKKLVWYKALDKDELPEGRVKSVPCGHVTVCMSHLKGQFAALDNRCPHQGGPLGEGSIEDGTLRCPWHGWDFDPLTGESAGGYDDKVETFKVEQREDGVYVGIEEEVEHARTVSDVMAETMVNWGVKHVWGMVGHSNLGLADALRVQEEQGKLSFYGIRHEGAASFAASAYGKLTGRPAACLAIAGPGATNLLTGLWDANVDHSPVLALTGQVKTQVLGRGNFQEVDLLAAYGKVAQFGHTVLHHSNHAELMTLACKSAILNQGVSHLVFPDEVQNILADDTKKAQVPDKRIVGSLAVSPPQESLDQALAMLFKAKRPTIIVGHGARFHMEPILQLAEELNCPVLTTFKGKGQISDRHPLGCGVLGRSGTPIASWFMNESDCLLVLGASFSNHTGIAPKVPTIHVDRDPMALGKFHDIEAMVMGDIGVTVKAFHEQLKGNHQAENVRDEIAERWKIWKAEKQSREVEDLGNGVNAAALFASMTRHVPEDAIIAVDVGNNTYSFGRYFECTSQSVLMSGYLGSIGFSFPAAMGAWAATQEANTPYHGRKVVSVSGDGGFGQYMGELTTAVKYGMNITHVLLNNSELGKISKEQRAGFWDVWQTSLRNPNFADYANNCGALGIRVTSLEELDQAFQTALAHDGPSLVEIMTDVTLL